MPRTLLITVRFHDGRFHGASEWPPSPARLFQALVAGAARGGSLPPEGAVALQWLENMPAPTIAAPAALLGRGVTTYVPNNDLDAKGGHPSRAAEIRVGKTVRPRLFDASVPLVYAWELGEGAENAAALCCVVTRLYQLGRGIDMAWGTGEILEASAATQRLADHAGILYRPTEGGTGGLALACPQPGSLASLVERHAARRRQFTPGIRKGQVILSQPPKPRFRSVSYDCPPARLLFELRQGDGFALWPLARTTRLVERLRDQAAARLQAALPERAAEIERLLIGRGAGPADIPRRPRILPLPSIGFVHTDHAIRRVLVEVPPECPITAADLRWAFNGLSLDLDTSTGEVLSETRLVLAQEDGMLRHYGLPPAALARCWRSVTPVALPRLPWQTGRRDGRARISEEQAASAALHQALRHTGELGGVSGIRVQPEPFTRHGQRAAAFAADTRFGADRLHHVELRFAEPRGGPLVLGDGRWLGLGLMAPINESPGVLAIAIVRGLEPGATPSDIAAALRRAVMARVQEQIGTAPLPPFFSGHAADGAPIRDERHLHIACGFDPLQKRLLLVAPHRFEGREPSWDERQHMATLDEALIGFRELRAGVAGRLVLEVAEPLADADSLIAVTRRWQSVTPFVPTRYAKRLASESVIVDDVRRECRRRGWPEPVVQVISTREGPRGGLTAVLELEFSVARRGPILLGRTAHQGGGLFRSIA